MRAITFYSYKGGTGRSLLLANFACYLSRFGRNVFILDADLEAPSLCYKFGLLRAGRRGIEPDTQRFDGKLRNGLVDFIKFYQNNGRFPKDFKDYFVELKKSRMSKGRCYLMPAGNPDPNVHMQVLQKLDWKDLFRIDPSERAANRLSDGVQLFEKLYQLIGEVVDDSPTDGESYLLIDSRTGTTEMGTVAMHLLADKVVCLSLSNPESLAGTAAVLNQLGKDEYVKDIMLVMARLPLDRINVDEYLESVTSKIRRSISPNGKIEKCLAKVGYVPSDRSLQVRESLHIDDEKADSRVIGSYLAIFQKLTEGDTGFEPVSVVKKSKVESGTDLHPTKRSVEPEPGSYIAVESRVKARGRIVFLNGGYVAETSRVNAPYSLFTDETVNRLARSIGHDIEVERFEAEQHLTWVVYPSHMSEGFIDFCCDPYYHTGFRQEFSDVIPIGSVSTFTCVVRRNCAIDGRLREQSKGPEMSFADRLIDLAMCFPNLEIGVLEDTAATRELFKAKSLYLPTYLKGHVVPFPKESELALWLSQAMDRRLIMCDHGVANSVVSCLPSATKEASYCYMSRLISKSRSGDSTHCIFRFHEELTAAQWRSSEGSILVGFLYPRGDHSWGSLIIKAMRGCLEQGVELNGCTEKGEVLWKKIMKSLQAVGIDPFKYNDLLERLRAIERRIESSENSPCGGA